MAVVVEESDIADGAAFELGDFSDAAVEGAGYVGESQSEGLTCRS